MQSKVIITSFLISFLYGCANNHVEDMLPQDGPTMKQVYDAHFTGQKLAERNEEEGNENEGRDNNTENDATASVAESSDIFIERRPLPADYDLSGYTRESNNEINQIFPRLANPTLVIYIYPHLSGSERHPVPGYSSAFTLYEKVEYALPGEPEARY